MRSEAIVGATEYQDFIFHALVSLRVCETSLVTGPSCLLHKVGIVGLALMLPLSAVSEFEKHI